MNAHLNHGEELRAPGTAMVGDYHLAGKPLMPFADLHEVTRLFSVGSDGGIRIPLGMRSGRKAVTNARASAFTASHFGTSICDISAEPFVTTKQQSGGTTQNKEAASVASCVHVPKLRLGETHVPERFSTRTRKNASGCGSVPLCTLLVDFGQ